MDENTITVNGHEMTQEEFEAKKREIDGKPGMTLVQLQEDVYKIKIQG